MMLEDAARAPGGSIRAEKARHARRIPASGDPTPMVLYSAGHPTNVVGRVNAPGYSSF